MSTKALKRILIVMCISGDRETDTANRLSIQEIARLTNTQFNTDYSTVIITLYLRQLATRNQIQGLDIFGQTRYRLTSVGFDRARLVWEERFRLVRPVAVTA